MILTIIIKPYDHGHFSQQRFQIFLSQEIIEPTTEDKMKLRIKYMVSLRCKTFIKNTLDNLGLHYRMVDLGEVDLIEHTISIKQRDLLRTALIKSGLELMDDKKITIVEKIKAVIFEMVTHASESRKTNISDYISEKMHRDYDYLSNLFTEITGTTIQQFILAHKIEKAKELILHDKFNLSEIAYKLHYSSTAHLSNQFRKITGLTPTLFRTQHAYSKLNYA